MTDNEKRMKTLRRLVREQVFDEGLMCKPETILEAYQRDALNLLHRIARDVDVEALEKIHWPG